jgi:thioester reductase-like protein
MTVLLTGGTGFVGMEVLLRLLEDGDEPVAALVRGRDQADADERLAAALDLVGVPATERPRVRAVVGELTESGLGLSARDFSWLTADVTSVVHCAASVSWNLPLDEARQVNVVGTQRVFELAEEIDRRGSGLDRCVHVSTAYVAGRHRGSFGEDDLHVGQDFRNTYEQTKTESESFVRKLADRLPISIVRPSIVVGESDSGWTPAFNVVYWPLRAFARGLLKEVPALPQGRVDIVPVDYVADAIVHALRAPDPPRVVHATAGSDAVTVEDLVELTCGLMERERPTLVDVGSEMSSMSDEADLYASYFSIEVVFDDARSRALLEPAGISPPPLESYFERLLDYAELARWGKRPVSRAEARLAVGQAAA